MTSETRRVGLLLSAAFGLFLCSVADAQTTTYTYTGQPFTDVQGSYTLGGSITGSFTLASPLEPFLPPTDISALLTAVSFSDGVATRTLANSSICTFNVATDGLGRISAWTINLREVPLTAPGNPQHTIDLNAPPPASMTGAIDFAAIGPQQADPCGSWPATEYGSTTVRGSWTSSSPPPAPNPTTYTYAGQPFTDVQGVYTLGGTVAGSFTLDAPLPPFFSSTNILSSLTAASFSDGVGTRTLANSSVCAFEVTTDGLGRISTWNIRLREAPLTAPGDPQHTIDLFASIPALADSRDFAAIGPQQFDPCGTWAATDYGSSTARGSWTGSSPPPPPNPTTYNYLSQPFTDVLGVYTLGGTITGSFTVDAPLPPLLPPTNILPFLSDASFSDGISTRTLTNSAICAFEIGTDGLGRIDRWTIYLREIPLTVPGDPQHTIDLFAPAPALPGAIDFAAIGPQQADPCGTWAATDYGSSTARGSWVGAVPTASIPLLEGPGLILLALLLAAAGSAALLKQGS